MARNYINIASFQQYNSAKKLTEGVYPVVIKNAGLAEAFYLLPGDLKRHKSAFD